MGASMIPNQNFSSSPIEPYNAVFAFNRLIENAEISILYDNYSLSRISQQQFKLANPTMQDMNFLISHYMSTVTAAFRFPCSNINDMRKIATSSVPFPRVHFFMPILANLQPRFS